MIVSDLLRRLLRELPEAPAADFVATVNDQVQVLWEGARWPYYLTTTTISATHSFSNLSIVNGASTATVSDDDAGGVFHALHAGKHFTIEGVAYTVSSVTDANTLVLSTVYDFGSGSNPESGTLPRVVFALPSDFAKMYRRPYRTSPAVGFSTLYPDHFMEDPLDFELTGPVSGVYTMEFRVLMTESYTLEYVRKVTAATGPGSTVDLWDGLDGALYQGLLRIYLRRSPAHDEIRLAQQQQRARLADQEYARRMHEAKGHAGTIRKRTGRNERRAFDL